ncbi:GNAT family N-acetyltransferase [Mailhella massiliensis]|uniref:GNAT family N-acetyltransferase n=1 Tax=Mailhella massiliensis TaxID=1903261 RepID=A0A921AWA2_9BACT|nr:GNAT family N-acetyltransferase [Mailhella massiliensis]HJD97298.1 GNAT family N-acetyltransferase [Mailhella massiliensis]
MIRPFCTDDTNAVIRLWLEASCEAHAFMPPSYWEAAAEDMRELYLPMSDEIVVHVDDATGEVDAFFAFVDTFLAALFVAPHAQGRGLGSRLLRIARRMHPDLSLCVYKENARAVAFYQKHGLSILGRRVEEKTGRDELLMGLAPAGEEARA